MIGRVNFSAMDHRFSQSYDKGIVFQDREKLWQENIMKTPGIGAIENTHSLAEYVMGQVNNTCIMLNYIEFKNSDTIV